MSHMEPGEPRVQEIIDAARGSMKCKIPQRLPSARPKPPAFKPKATPNSKSVVVSAQQPRFASRPPSRPRSGEQARPKSAGRTKDDNVPPKHGVPVTRAGKTEKDRFFGSRRPSVIPKRINEMPLPNKVSPRTVITVPVTPKQLSKTLYTNRTMTCLPDQETINRHEDLELQQGDLEGIPSPGTDLNEGDSITSRSDRVTQLKITWQENIVQFEKIKSELNEKQKDIMEVYATLGVTHQKMSALGQRVTLPPAEELRIMNVANLTPDELLQLCANARYAEERQQQDLTKMPVAIDINKLYNMPSKLVATCEQALVKRKEIIDVLESITKKKDISLNQLLKKIKEFTAENEMLNCSLDKVKSEFNADLNEIVNYLRKCVNDIMAAQLRNEQLTYQLSELNAQKDDLRKQIHNADHLKSNVHKMKFEELEKQLKEEKCKRTLLRDRLTRAEGQVKINTEQASQLEAALEQSRSKCWNLERTVQQLREENKRLQEDFDKELNKFTESIRENTAHLEDIAEAREKLQTEKEELEKQLTELSINYAESLKHVKHEMNSNVVKLIEIEKRYEDEKNDKQKSENKVESLCSQLVESELRYKDICKQLQEKESQLSKTLECYRELEVTKHNLVLATKEIDEYRKRLSEQSEAVKEIERNFREALKLEEDLRRDIKNKDDYISELEKKMALLEKQLEESENKIKSNDEELAILKTHVAQIQEDFGEFTNLNELRHMINQQRAKLLEATRQNGELAEALQKKDLELERHFETVAEQEHIIKQRDDVIKMLSDKEEEQANILKLLRNNLELRTQADADFNQQLSEKNTEIESLITNLDTRKQQISQLEKIIITMDVQASTQQKEDQERIAFLENELAKYEAYHMERKRSLEAPADNLDSIIKILEDELGTSADNRPSHTQHSFYTKKNQAEEEARKQEKLEYHSRNNRLPMYYEGHEKYPTKVKTNTCGKNTFENHKGDILDRKKANTNIDTQNNLSSPEPGLNVFDVPATTPDNLVSRGKMQTRPKDIFLSRNVNFFAPLPFREDKKCKMYKFAGHRL